MSSLSNSNRDTRVLSLANSSFMNKALHFVGATLLASGTSIGAGMLALPVLTGLAGFYPAIIIYIASWLLMTYTSFLILEVVLWMKGEANIISMASKTLGRTAKYIAFGLYVFLFYSVSIAYLAGSGSIILDVIDSIFGVMLPRWSGIVISLGLFGPSVYFGTKAVANLNILLILGIAISYILLLSSGVSLIDETKLVVSNWSYAWMGIPVIMTSFTFQNVIPSISTYLQRNISMLKGAIMLGGIFPLIIYCLWEAFVLGIVPLAGDHSIREALITGQPATHALKELLANPWITIFSEAFAFCAIVTSFLGVILGLFDFLADGFKIKKIGHGRLILCGLIFIPPLIFALYFQRAFLTALNYAGSFGCVTLFIILPALMVLKGRYYYKFEGEFSALGGKKTLISVAIIGIFILLVQCGLSLGFLPSH